MPKASQGTFHERPLSGAEHVQGLRAGCEISTAAAAAGKTSLKRHCMGGREKDG